MGSIFMMTMARTLRPKYVLPYFMMIAAVSAGGTLFAENLSNTILQGRIISFNTYYTKLVFFWILGPPFLFWIAGYGIRLISEERNQGTLLLLVSKPLPRYSIILGKYLGLVMSALLIGECSLFLALAVIILMVSPDPVIIFELLKTILFLGMYLLFLIICISALSLSASILFKEWKKAFGVFLIITLAVYGGFPFLRFAIYFYFPQYLCLLYFDLNAYLTGIFCYFLSLEPGIMLSPYIVSDLSYWYLGFLPQFLKIREIQEQDLFVGNPPIVILILLAFSLIILTFSIRQFKKMDILE
ncbi:MAG: hypothetical protein AWM53_01025 [Candidatus Dichloromethanomonas elyunquensis]|nr:MAG: hypothetical protein AWM53_01025 [Candidatus Dichloromethanomonas elyunquensis]